MMLSDEPYRWAEAVANRRDYIEDQIRTGSPVVGVGYEDGVLLLTLSQSQQKVFEVYDRIALAAIGHSTDIEKLRQAAIDMAHSIGFNYSEDDVTLRQIVYFGLGPAMKAGFDDVVRSPFLARVFLAELDGQEGAQIFYTVDYDGAFYRHEGCVAVGGVCGGGCDDGARVVGFGYAGVVTVRCRRCCASRLGNRAMDWEDGRGAHRCRRTRAGGRGGRCG